jgi:hypothetical protein
MALLSSFVWMGIGRDLIAVHTQVLPISPYPDLVLRFIIKSLQRVELEGAHNDRIQDIIAVQQTNQVWGGVGGGLIEKFIYYIMSGIKLQFQFRFGHALEMEHPVGAQMVHRHSCQVCVSDV